MATTKETEMHEHKYQRVGHIESCECGDARVVVDAATQARRDAATIAFKRRYNAVYAKTR